MSRESILSEITKSVSKKPAPVFIERSGKKRDTARYTHMVHKAIQLEDKDQLYWVIGGSESADGYTTLRKDFGLGDGRGVIINDKNVAFYRAWLSWLNSLSEKEVKDFGLSIIDQSIKDKLRKVKDFEHITGHDIDIFKNFLKKELGLSDNDLEIINKQYSQGVGSCFDLIPSIFTLQGCKLSIDSPEEEYKRLYRHCNIGNKYHVFGLSASFSSIDSSTDKATNSVKTDSTGHTVMTDKGYRIESASSILHPILLRLLAADSDEKGIAPMQTAGKRKYPRNESGIALGNEAVDIAKVELERQKIRFEKNLAFLHIHPSAPDLRISFIKRYAEEISQLPDVSLADFNELLEEINAYAKTYRLAEKITDLPKLHRLCEQYYQLLIIHQKEKLNNILLPLYQEAKDGKVKAKLGELLFVRLDELKNTPDPVGNQIVETFKKVHQQAAALAKSKKITVDAVQGLIQTTKKINQSSAIQAPSPNNPTEGQNLLDAIAAKIIELDDRTGIFRSESTSKIVTKKRDDLVRVFNALRNYIKNTTSSDALEKLSEAVDKLDRENANIFCYRFFSSSTSLVFKKKTDTMELVIRLDNYIKNQQQFVQLAHRATFKL